MMWRTLVGLFLAAASAGCSGNYVITTPDALGSGEQAQVVTRLRRQEFWRLATPVEKAVVRITVAEQDGRAAYTSKRGWAVAVVPAPATTGTYPVSVAHLDEQGDEGVGEGRCYVIDPNVWTVAVDFEAIEDVTDAGAAAGPLQQLRAGGVQIVYIGDGMAEDTGKAHRWLTANALPDGPVLGWDRRRDWLFRGKEVVGALAAARQQTPGLMVALWSEDDVKRAVEDLRMVALEAQPWEAQVRRILAAAVATADKDLAAMTPETVRDALNAAGE